MNALDLLQLQKKTFQIRNIPSLSDRISRLSRLEQLLKENTNEIIQAIELDFRGRGYEVTYISDILSVILHIRYIKSKLRKWITPFKRPSDFPFNLTGAQSYIVYEPLGVVGIISAFNSPVSTTFTGTADAFAAGNSVIIKPSDLVPSFSDLIKRLLDQYFAKEEIGIIEGGVEETLQFASLPFDHLMFTGSSETAKQIASLASKNLTPLLLELGGKTPVIILDDNDLEALSEKIVKARLLNAGQICLSPDYILAPRFQIPSLVEHLIKSAEKIESSGRYIPTSIISKKHFDRIQSLIEEARFHAKQVIESNSSLNKNQSEFFIPFTLVIEPSKNLRISNEEIFGPVLPIIPYDTIEEIINTINEGKKPLAVYIFGNHKKNINAIINRTSSGGVCVNDFFLQAGQMNLPVGGVGSSGYGRFRGDKSGFITFSNAKSVFKQGFLKKITTALIPPMSKDLWGIIKFYGG